MPLHKIIADPGITEKATSGFKLIWSRAEKIGSLVSLIIVFLVLLGFRIDKPSERFEKLERRDSVISVQDDKIRAQVDALRTETTGMKDQINMLVRMRCLSMWRSQAVLVGVCDGFKTADDTIRRKHE